MRDTEFYITAATDAFEAGFVSEAGRKRALSDVSRAYEDRRTAAHGAQITHANDTPELGLDHYQDRMAFFAANEMPFDLHQVRDRHLPIFAAWGVPAERVRELIDLRAAIKAAAIAPVQVNETAVRVETIRKSILEIMEQRGVQYVEALELGRMFGGLPVSVNAHIVHGHKGTVFVRHFFYLAGRLTPLNVIMAAADTLEREKA